MQPPATTAAPRRVAVQSVYTRIGAGASRKL